MDRPAPDAPPPPSLTRKVIAGSSLYTAANAMRQLLAFVLSAVLARLLTPESYGVMGMAAVITVFLNNLRDLGTAAAIVQRETLSIRLLHSLFWANTIMGVAVGLVVLTITPAAARFFAQPLLLGILPMLGLSLTIVSLSIVHNSLLVRQMAFGKVAAVEIISVLAGYTVAIYCAMNGFGVWSLVYSNLCNALVTTLLTWLLSRWMTRPVFDWGELRAVGAYSLNMAGFTMVNYFARNADNIIIGKFRSAGELGHYQMAYNLMLYPLINITGVVAQVLFPAFSRIQSDSSRYRAAFTRSCSVLSLITFPIMAGLGVIADPMVRAVFGPKWIPVIPLIQILAPVGVIQSVVGLSGQVFAVVGRTDLLFRIGLINAVVLVLSFLAGVRYGAVGVAIAYLIVYSTFCTFMLLRAVFRLLEMPASEFLGEMTPHAALLVPMVLSCITWLALLDGLTPDNHWLRLFTTIVAGALVYILAVLYFRPPGLRHLETSAENMNLPIVPALLRITRIFAR